MDEPGWLQPAAFGAAVAFSHLTPGPVLITSTFIGFRVAGLSGAAVATIGVFLMPWALATATAQGVARVANHPALQAFGAGAGPAVIGIFGVTVLARCRDTLVAWP